MNSQQHNTLIYANLRLCVKFVTLLHSPSATFSPCTFVFVFCLLFGIPFVDTVLRFVISNVNIIVFAPSLGSQCIHFCCELCIVGVRKAGWWSRWYVAGASYAHQYHAILAWLIGTHRRTNCTCNEGRGLVGRVIYIPHHTFAINPSSTGFSLRSSPISVLHMLRIYS